MRQTKNQGFQNRVQVEGMLTSWLHYHLTPSDIENAVWTTAVYANAANMGDFLNDWLVGFKI